MPMRILVRGASTAVWMSDFGGPRTDFTYPRAIEAALFADGRPAVVHVRARAGSSSLHLLRTWEDDVMAWSPDVIVLNIGHYETIHLVIPRWFERWANDLRRRPTRIRRTFRQRVIRPPYSVLLKVQKALDARFGRRFAHRPARKVAVHCEKAIRLAQRVGSPLVLIPELAPPGSKYERYFPGIGVRIEAMNAALSAMVESMALPNVRFVPTRGLFPADIDKAVPDGAHFTPDAHRALGEHLASIIAGWADTQAHLAVAGGELSANWH